MIDDTSPLTDWRAIRILFVDGRVDGAFGEWSHWSPCLSSCSQNGGQIITRSRLCNSPPPMNGGRNCDGERVERVSACFNKCPSKSRFNLCVIFAFRAPSLVMVMANYFPSIKSFEFQPILRPLIGTVALRILAWRSDKFALVSPFLMPMFQSKIYGTEDCFNGFQSERCIRSILQEY